MKTALKKMGSAVLCTALLLALLPALPARAEIIVPDHLIVGEYQYLLHEGTWDKPLPPSVQFNAQTGVLRLDNHTCDVIDAQGFDLTLELVGKSTIHADVSHAVRVLEGSLTVAAATPGAELHITGTTASTGFFAEGHITLNGVAVYMDNAPRMNAGIWGLGRVTIGQGASLSISTTPMVGDAGSTLLGTAIIARGGLYTPGSRWLREGESTGTLRAVPHLSLEMRQLAEGIHDLCTPAHVQVSPAAELATLTPATGSLPAGGGSVSFTLTGTNLPEGVTFTAFEDGIATGITAVALGGGTQASASLSFGPNTGTANKSYTIRVMLPFEADYRQAPAATLTLPAPGASRPTDPATDPNDPPATPSPQPVAVKGLALSMGAKMLKKGQTVTLKATVSPANATDKNVVWTSSNSKVAKVSSKGVVKAVKNGKATITAKAGGKTAKCVVTVSASASRQAVRSVKLSKRTATLKTSRTLRLTATVTPQAAKQKKVVWTSSNPKIATVSASGVVKALGKGTVKITASSYEGGRKAVCAITVK